MTRNILLCLCLGASVPAHAQAAKTAKQAKPADVMMRIDGTAITREDVAKRMWKRYAGQAVNELVDELLVSKAVKELKVSVEKSDIDKQIERLRSQFPDETAFQRHLGALGTDMKELRGQVEAQLQRERLVVKAKDLKVTDVEAKMFFDSNKDNLGAPESVHLKHILFKTEKEALAALADLRGGADFSAMAAKLSLDPSGKANGGDLGFVSRASLDPEVAKTAFSLKPGELGGPLKLANGFHILKAAEVRPPKAAAFAEMKDELMRNVLAEKISQAWPVYIRELRDKAKVEVN
jgi:foldase protein PrsA